VIAPLQIYYRAFDAAFFELPRDLQQRIESKIDDLALRMNTFPHERLRGSNRYRLRIGHYRVIYTFDLQQGLLYLLALGHRREIYRKR
jgi:mRNA interferase RelE/StbE